jgi:hypothetical protein
VIAFPQKLESWPHDVLPLVEKLLDPDSIDSGLVVCDATPLESVLPIGLCGLAASCNVLASRGTTVKFENLSTGMQSYFDRMDVFDQCHIAYESTIQRHGGSDRLLEIRCLDSPSEVHRVAGPLVVAITGQMMRGQEDSEDADGMRGKPSERLALSLEYVMSELLENAVTHAQANGFRHAKVWIAANYYDENNLVRVAFVDTGCGFQQSLRFDDGVKESPNDLTAIRRALEPFVSCNRGVGILDDSSNQGIGLTVCADIARETGGRLIVSSGNATLNATSNVNYPHFGYWQGAALDVVLHRDQLLNLNLSSVVRPYQPETRPRLRFI